MSADFEARKKDHIRLSLDPKNQAEEGNGLNKVKLTHQALPDLNLSDINLTTKVLGKNRPTPFFVSSMTAGHSGSGEINKNLCQAASLNGWMVCVGSQRRELFDKDAGKEWKELRSLFPDLPLISNIGLAQAIESPTDQIKKLVDNLNAEALIIHCNILQECIQPEGTPNFKGGMQAIEGLAKSLSVPVIVKETGCGFSSNDYLKLMETSASVVDVSGYGGTHWGRIEGARSGEKAKENGAKFSKTSKVFKNWGISTYDSLMAARTIKFSKEIWVSGGLETGLDAAKGLCLGASAAGYAGALLKDAVVSGEAVSKKMNQIVEELKVAMICTNSQSIKDLTIDKIG